MLVEIVFWTFAVLIVLSALVAVLSKNVIYSVFALLFTFFGVAGIYVLLNADFIAITQILIYIGGILVLLIFGVMLTSNITSVDIRSGQIGVFHTFWAGLISLLVIAGISYIALSTNWATSSSHSEQKATIETIGNSLLTNYLLAFESSSVLLLIAIIGAALIARRK
ncbi:MAG: NADH-quinone oxidoreductase subunit J [Ignavibacteria bacterium]|nr:NADH-quinone oxidoreductase subunit J [Ignavibacteria bacterium]